MTMKRLLALLWAVLLLCALCACGKDANDANATTTTTALRTPPAEDIGVVAETFLTAYMMRNYAVRYDMYCYDARAQWEDSVKEENGGSADAFFAEAQKQAEAKGLDYTVDSFDSYLSAYHQFILADYTNTYGTFTVSVEAVDSVKQDAETMAKTIDGLLSAVNEKYLDMDKINAITEAYTIEVEFRVDGDKKDYFERKLVQIVNYDGEWKVISHSI